MNTWIVGHVPAGHIIRQPQLAGDSSPEKPGEKTFFMRGRIMAGQADLKGNQFGLSDFNWLTKQEVEKVLDRKYFEAVKNMMSDR
jgi:large subunit ribosomal protein L46